MRFRLATTALSLICATALCLPALAVSQCLSHEAPYKARLGVVQMNIGRTDDWRSRIDEMIRFGVKSVRLNAKAGREADLKAIAYAQKSGMDVLMAIHVTDKDFFDLSSEKRAGGEKVRDQRPLSQLDLSLFEKHFRKIIKSLDDMQVSIPMVEIGNEINWAGYNGDIPIMEQGRVFQSSNDLGPHKEQVYRGFKRYESALRIAKKELMESKLQKNMKIISAGLMSSGSAEPLTQWFKRSGGTMLSLSLVNRIYDELGISKLVDGRGIHIYPDIKKNQKIFNNFDLIRDIVNKASTQCSPSGEPCYVTEWGFNSDHDGCAGDDPREKMFRDFMSALSCHSNFYGAWVFTWKAIGDEHNRKKEIYRCGRSASFGGLLRDQAKTFKQPPLRQ